MIKAIRTVRLSPFLIFAAWIGTAAVPAFLPAQTGAGEKKEETPMGAEQESAPPQVIEPGKPIDRQMEGAAVHPYRFSLDKGQFIQLIVDQKGIDVELRLFDPQGTRLTVVDTPSGTQGPEQVSEVAEAAGDYRLEVASTDEEALPGRYSLRVEQLRPATETDRKHVPAERAFADGDALRRNGKRSTHQQALEKFSQVLEASQALEDRKLEAEAHYRIGWLLHDLRHLEEAIPHYEEALSLYRQLEDRFNQGTLLNRIGGCRYLLGEADQALALHQQALEIFQQINDRASEASTRGLIGNAYALNGEVLAAIQAYEAAVSLADEVEDIELKANSLHGLGHVLVYQGKLEEAEDSFSDALRIWRDIGAESYQAIALNWLANVHQRQGKLGNSRDLLQQALNLRRESGDDNGEGITLNSLGTVLLMMGEVEEAGKSYQRALELFRNVKNRHGEAFALLNLGRYHWERHEAEKALQYHEEAAALFHEIGNRRGEASTLFGSARALHALEDYAGARERLRKVKDSVEALRDTAESLDLRVSYFATKQHYYELYIDVLMHLHDQDPQAGFDLEAFQVSEQKRARGLLELLAEAHSEIRRGADPKLLEEEKRLQHQLNALQLRLLESRRKNRQEEIASLEKSQRGLLLELDDVRRRIRLESPQYGDLIRPELATPKEIRTSLLDDESVLLVYSLGDERSFLWCFVPGEEGVRHYKLPPRAWIEDLAKQVHSGWKIPRYAPVQSVERWAERLSDALLDPPARMFEGKKRILVVGDGALHYLPFAALPAPRAVNQKSESSERSPLLAHYEVIHLPSASVLAALRRQLADRMPAPRRIAVIADPVFSPDDSRVAAAHPIPFEVDEDLKRSALQLGIGAFERLRYTREEARFIRKLVPENMRYEALDFEASKDTILNGRLRRYRVLHFATHGLLNRKHPELSGLVLSLVDRQGKPVDGFLRTHEIYNLDLPAELAFLSACETGLGVQVKGEGIVGVTRGFMYAGVPRIVVSLWQVGDKGTSELTKRFYKGLFQENLPPSEALRQAQLSMWNEEEWKSPFHWAGFVFQGEWRVDFGSGDSSIEKIDRAAQPADISDDDLPAPIIPVDPQKPPED